MTDADGTYICGSCRDPIGRMMEDGWDPRTGESLPYEIL